MIYVFRSYLYVAVVSVLRVQARRALACHSLTLVCHCLAYPVGNPALQAQLQWVAVDALAIGSGRRW